MLPTSSCYTGLRNASSKSCFVQTLAVLTLVLAFSSVLRSPPRLVLRIKTVVDVLRSEFFTRP
jgi:hypothetical protein